ncbi:LOB domain-containing protein 1-like [Benincasa hispida]|uniref:LOB domain-containing protein 1-like n=1 Tax=Benincasa hispida TaxID=102211 RepID=UPI001901B67A|nr:LOB domain-containing protein 1-like [Benincasa hispida]
MAYVAKCTNSPPTPINVPNHLSFSPMSSSSAAATTTNFASPPTSQPSSPPLSAVVLSPCAACKILRRRCVEKCVLAPYFPPTEPLKFTIAHRVFGASNIIKFLQELPESQRTDAVSSMVYEANARLRDPVYGSAGAICQLQKQVSELQAQLAKARAEVANMQQQQANLLALICMEMRQSPEPVWPPQLVDTTCFLDDATLSSPWEPLWT